MSICDVEPGGDCAFLGNEFDYLLLRYYNNHRDCYRGYHVSDDAVRAVHCGKSLDRTPKGDVVSSMVSWSPIVNLRSGCIVQCKLNGERSVCFKGFTMGNGEYGRGY